VTIAAQAGFTTNNLGAELTQHARYGRTRGAGRELDDSNAF
jgi:hypothetical protein